MGLTHATKGVNTGLIRITNGVSTGVIRVTKGVSTGVIRTTKGVSTGLKRMREFQTLCQRCKSIGVFNLAENGTIYGYQNMDVYFSF
jgi:hypothetical protein